MTANAALLTAMFGEGEDPAPVLTEANFEGEVWERAYEWADSFSDVYGCDHVARERLTVAFASAIKEAAAPPIASFDETVKRFTTFVFADGDVSIQLVKAHIKQFAEAIRPRVEYDEAMLTKMMQRHNEMSARICQLETPLYALTPRVEVADIDLDELTRLLSAEVTGAVLTPVETMPPLVVTNDALKELWSQWADFYTKHFRAAGIALSMADKQAFFEIGQPIMMALATRSRP